MSDAISKPDQSHAEAMAKVMKLIAGNKICMLTTRDQNGELLSRPMAVDEREFDGTLWFVCHNDTRKVEHVRHDPRVNVSFSSGGEWLSIIGRAEIVQDRAKLKEVWDAGASAWFPEGPDGPKIALFKVDAEGAEYWDTPGGALIASVFSFVKAKTTGEPYKVENDTVEI